MNLARKIVPAWSILILGPALLAFPLRAQYAGPESGQKVAFMGDSITQFGTSPSGYVTLVEMALKDIGKPIVVIPAGVSGNTSKDMIARLQKDVLDKKPDWMTLSCGVNDVWHGAGGVELDPYEQNITSMVDQATAAGIKVVLLTSTMIGEDQPNPNNQKLTAYNDFLRKLATERHLSLVDLNAAMQDELAKQKAAATGFKGYYITVDGVHMNCLGNQMMAEGILKAMGVTDAQIAPEKEKWMDIPGAVTVNVSATLTARQYLQFRTEALGQNTSFEYLFDDYLAQDLQRRSKASAPQTSPAKP